MGNAAYPSDYTLVDTAEYALGLKDVEAVADTLELLASLMTDPQVMLEDEHLRRVPSALHALGDYLSIRSKHLRSIGSTSDAALSTFSFSCASVQEGS